MNCEAEEALVRCNKKTSVRVRTEGERIAVPPLVRQILTEFALRASDNALRGIGRTRLFLLPPFQKSHSGRYLGGFPHCLAPNGSSLAGKWTLTCSNHCVYQDILTKSGVFVKRILGNRQLVMGTSKKAVMRGFGGSTSNCVIPAGGRYFSCFGKKSNQKKPT